MFLGRTEVELVGASIDVLCGPSTDTIMLICAIEEAAACNTASSAIPLGTVACYLNVTDSRGCITSSEIEFL